MRARFNQSFKKQAVEKALNRQEGVRIEDIAGTLGVGFSTLQKWIRKSKDQELETVSTGEMYSMAKEKRPQDWSLAERLEMVIACGGLDDEGISELCRTKGIYPHHVNQWKSDFASGKNAGTGPQKQVDSKKLKSENKALKRELNRKEKALAEAAALLVLQKKVNALWGNDDEEDSQ